MKTFKDLEFEIINDGFMTGKKSTIHFDNGYGASVVSHTFSYGGKMGLYELVVLKDNEFHYDNPVAGGDVRGFLSEKGVTNLLIQIQNFK
jgi:hypothetical protein